MSDFLNRDLRKDSYLSVCSSVNCDRTALHRKEGNSVKQHVVEIIHNIYAKQYHVSQFFHKAKLFIVF